MDLTLLSLSITVFEFEFDFSLSLITGIRMFFFQRLGMQLTFIFLFTIYLFNIHYYFCPIVFSVMSQETGDDVERKIIRYT